MLSRLCVIEGCGKPYHARGYCSMHVKRWRRHGDPHKKLRISNGEALRYFRKVVLAYDGDECLIWPHGKSSAGYGLLRNKIVSRLICTHFNDTPPTPKHEAAHSCGRGHLGCVTKRHLSWKTHAENQADKLLHDTHNRGERHYGARLTEAEVRQIRALKGKETNRMIAARFGINPSVASRIQARLSWAWLAEEA